MAIENVTDQIINCSDIEANALSLATDRIQIGWQLIAAIAGLPINLLVLYRLIVAKHRRQRDSYAYLLYTLLSIANIVILVVHCCGFSVWQFSFWWNSTDLACRLFKFLDACGFYLSSNATVSIAIDLYCSIVFPMSARINGPKRERWLVAGSVALSMLTSAPQLVLWATTAVDCDDGSVRAQCIFLYWDKQHAIVTYSLFHNVILFWIPLGIITPCYVRISFNVYKHYATGSYKGPQQAPIGVAPKRSLIETIRDLLRDDNEEPPTTRKNAVVPTVVVIDEAPNETKRTSWSKSVRILRKTFGGTSAKCQKRSVRRKRARVLTSSLLIITTFLLSWMPYQISSVLEFYADEEGIDTELIRYMKCVAALLVLGTLVNPFLYKLTSIRKERSVRFVAPKAVPPPLLTPTNGSFRRHVTNASVTPEAIVRQDPFWQDQLCPPIETLESTPVDSYNDSRLEMLRGVASRLNGQLRMHARQFPPSMEPLAIDSDEGEMPERLSSVRSSVIDGILGQISRMKESLL